MPEVWESYVPEVRGYGLLYVQEGLKMRGYASQQNLSDTAYIRYSGAGSGSYEAYDRSAGDSITYTQGWDFDKQRLTARLKQQGYRKVVDTTRY